MGIPEMICKGTPCPPLMFLSTSDICDMVSLAVYQRSMNDYFLCMCLCSQIIILENNYLWLAVEKYHPEKNEGQK